MCPPCVAGADGEDREQAAVCGMERERRKHCSPAVSVPNQEGENDWVLAMTSL
ncbi:hypothetical protein chiPu_0028290, partial [Chiloscyllium punctatum]|nr:hypothetical protein [Chiloscyllium punctatum]